MSNVIAVEIAKIKDVCPNEYAQKQLDATKKYADEYMEFFKSIITKQSEYFDLIKELKNLNTHPFYEWINAQPGFRKAKTRLVNESVIFAKIENVNSAQSEDYARQYMLEYHCANVISLSLCHPNLNEIIVVPKKWKQFVDRYEKGLALMSRNFELEGEEQLFIYLINRLKTSDGSIINSGKKHISQLREFMIKRLIQSVYQLANDHRITNSMVANIALDISGIFFEGMKQSDAEELAKEIFQYVERNNHFLQQKVIDLLLSKS